MKYSKLSIVFLFFIVLAGCMTMDTLRESKDEYKKGNYISGTFTGLLGLTVVPIADIFTLGGTLSADEAAWVWTGATNSYQSAGSNQSISSNTCNSIPKNTPANAARACQCEKGRVEQRNDYVGCQRTPSTLSWGCSFFDGRHQCAVR